MAGKSQLQRAIDKIDQDAIEAVERHKQEMAVLQAARNRLVAELDASRAKKGRQS